ncbi:MAG TPA: GNAT family N-acetyltransferase [Actinomycetota bacterium]|nr:GNAT family N-acetyltransferase [Actinomycetota bacterium]
MSLPDFVRRFWYASIELGQRTARTPWGAVTTDRRYPLVWDANNATVLEPAKGLTAAAIRADLAPALHAAGAPFEHVEFWDISAGGPALEEYRRSGQRPDPDMVMVLDRLALPGRGGSVQTLEVARPDRSFWDWYRESLHEFGTAKSEDLLDQMTDRTAQVFVPAGLRFYVGLLDGQRVGYASLLSLEGVGYLDHVVTMPSLRRRGVATATVTAAVQASLSGGDRHLFLLAERDGEPQRLYERLGFRVQAAVESFTRLLAEDRFPA